MLADLSHGAQCCFKLDKTIPLPLAQKRPFKENKKIKLFKINQQV